MTSSAGSDGRAAGGPPFDDDDDDARPARSAAPTAPGAAIKPGSSDGAADSVAATAHLEGEVGSLASLLRDRGEPAPLALVPGTLVGEQYRIERALGAGGMGVVYLATDVPLGREVAIKLAAVRSTSMLARLEREAAALARLSHPNVVVVHHIGEHDGRVFIAMEHVAGGTAREWLRARARTWREIVQLYAAAGDGLAAAHAAGLVHRDFKPDNVLVGSDGRPRVADFGLVRADVPERGPDRGDERGDRDDEAAGDDAPDSTRAGAVLGTPAYMPPEQLAGAPVDAQADQFAFAASLWEALYGQRPFAGSTPAELASAIKSTPPAAGSSARRVPRHLRDALTRALAAAPRDRWSSMAPLLAALRRDPAARRRRVALVLGGAVVAAAIAVPLARRGGAAPDPCRDGPAALAPTWSAARGARVAAAVGERGWPALASRLQRYTAGWLAGHRAACLATRIDRSQSDDLLDRRMQCLHRARIALGVTLDQIERDGTAAAASAAAALDGLPDLEACSDVAGLAAAEPLPTDPAVRARVEEAVTLVATAHAATYQDMKPGTEALADQAVAAARAAGWRPQIAEALATRASAWYENGRFPEAIAGYQEAAELALAGGSDRVATANLTDLAWALAETGADAEAVRLVRLARALWERQGRRPQEARKVYNALAFVAQLGGRHDEAIATIRELIALTEGGGAVASPAHDHYNLASALIGAGRIDEGLPPLARAIALAEQTDGPQHANVARYLSLQAWALRDRGDLDGAEAAARRAITILEAWFGPADRRLPYVLETLGEVLASRGRTAEAVAVLRRTAAIATATSDTETAARATARVAALASP